VQGERTDLSIPAAIQAIEQIPARCKGQEGKTLTSVLAQNAAGAQQ
jgi:hypothetical protein